MTRYRLFYEQQMRQAMEQGPYVARVNTNTAKQHSSLRDISELKPILLRDMKINQIHYGHYLECKTLAEPFYVTGMSLIVEDNTGEIENVMLYNFNAKSYDINPSYLIPAGTKLIIKEPFLKLFACGNGEFGIRVETPTDVILINNDFFSQSTVSQSVDELIENGNLYFKKFDFYSSIRYYTEAFKKSNETNVRAVLNRSASYFKLERYYLAYKDAEKAAQLDDKCEKAYYRMGKAAYEMRQFEVAEKNFKNFLKYNKLQDAEIELKKCQDRVNETLTGDYDFKSIVDQALKKENLFFDVADFKSNKIKVADVKNKSKGVIASQDIKKGELLVVSKAISSVFIDKNSKNYNIQINMPKNSFDMNDGSQNFSNIVYKMHSDPGLAKEIYSLYAGPDYARNDKINEHVIDISRISAIQKYNSFTTENHFELSKKEEKNDVNKESGFWLFPSYFNHSCVGNTIRIFLGDLLIMYAIRDIKKNEEITTHYFSSSDTYAERGERAFKTYNFKCDCQLCKLDREDSNLKKREKLLHEIMTNMKKIDRLSLNECLEDVSRMRNTYSKRTDLQVGLIPALLKLACKYRENFNYQTSAKIFEEAYYVAKDIDFMYAITALKQASVCYKLSAQQDLHDWCYENASQYFGNNKPFFEKFWER